MKLKQVQIDHFRNILNSGDVVIDPSVTCMVGKNEAGKTGFLAALHRLNPNDKKKFDVHADYPAWLEKRHRLEGKDPSKVEPVTATFALEPDDQKRLGEDLGTVAACIAEYTVSRDYTDDVAFDFEFDEAAWVKDFNSSLDSSPVKPKDAPETAAELAEMFDSLAVAPDEGQEDIRPHIANLKKQLLQATDNDFDIEARVRDWLWENTPEFLYFDNYSGLPGVLDIAKIAGAAYDNLTPDLQTAKALLEVAYADTSVATGQDYERRKRELENTANAITQEVLEYWSQNTDIRVEIDFNQRRAGNNQPIVHELHIRLYDNAHMLSLPFDKRSSGFRWFFSFLCAFSRYRLSGDPVIILLDEPALGLHARAQGDFLLYIEDKLAPKCQVVYTTHSPFMVPPEHLDRVRLVEDKGKKEGSVVSSDVMSTDKDTLFPLQGALGYHLAQNMLIGPNNLIVEGTSDYTYLTLMSTHLSSVGRTGLDDRWTIVPVGGADNITTFVALLAQHVDATVLLDSHPRGNQRLDNLVVRGIFDRSRILGIGDVTGTAECDIEDMFAPGEYLKLYNAAFMSKVKVGDLAGKDPIVRRLARLAGVPRFDHGRPAEVLLRDHSERIPKLSDGTRDRFEDLFKRINATMKTS